MRANSHKRRRLATQHSPASHAAPAAVTSPGDTDVAPAAVAAPSPQFAALPMLPRPLAASIQPPPRTFAQVLAAGRQAAALGIQPPLTPPLGSTRPPMPSQAPPPPPLPQTPIDAATSVAPEPVAPAAPNASPIETGAEPLNALAQLRLQQGMNIDQWRSTALAGIDQATSLTALSQALAQTQALLATLPDRAAWRARRAATLEDIVDGASTRMAELARHAGDVAAMVPLYQALRALAPEAFTNKRSAFLDAAARIGERIFSAAGDDITTLEHAFTAFENGLPLMDVGFEAAADTALRAALVSSLWYRLLEAPDALSSWSIQTWTSRSQSLCHMRPCPQIAALVWLRALLAMPQLSVDLCVGLTHQLREAWAVPDAPAPTSGDPAPAAAPTHLPVEPAFEPVARTQLTTWVAVLTDQLPALAPFQAVPVREAFSQLADALHFHIDVEIGLPATDGDADMQARELADFVRQWEREHRRPFPGYEALFQPADDGDADADAPPAASQYPQLDAFFPHDDFLGAELWTPAAPRSETPYSERGEEWMGHQDVSDAVDWLDQSPSDMQPLAPPGYSARRTSPAGARTHQSSEAASPSSSEYSSIPDAEADWP